MQRIGLISDTHGVLLPFVERAFAGVDEIWHAGDIGNLEILDALKAMKPLRAVYGNIDGWPLRSECPGHTFFTLEDVKVLMLHIGGYPGKYSPEARKLIRMYQPTLMVSGHSHILKVMFDSRNTLLYMNPGAAGTYGFHQVKTVLRFTLDNGKIENLEVVEA